MGGERYDTEGLVRGHELTGTVEVETSASSLLFHTTGGGAPLVIPFSALDGLRRPGDLLTLYILGGDIVELHGSAAAIERLARDILRARTRLPELTLPLRAFASVGAGEEQARFFAPLLDARRRAEEGARSARDPLATQLRAFDAGRLKQAVVATVQALAAGRWVVDGGDRRALHERLRELVEPLESSLDSLGNSARALRNEPGEYLFARWQEWKEALRLVFSESDRAWLAMQPVLAAAPEPRQPRLWHRLLRRAQR